MEATTTTRTATEKQLNFIDSLLDQVGPDTRWTAVDWLNDNYTSERRGDLLPIDKASSVIDRLLKAKDNADQEHADAEEESRLEQAAEAANERALSGEDRWVPEDPGEAEAQRNWDREMNPAPRYLLTEDYTDIPAGRYAVTGEDGTTDFYHVQYGKNRWEGKLFVKLHVAGREDTNLRVANAITVLEKIRRDGPREAAVRYGHAIGRCSCCGRELTNEDSRAAGIGPVCAEKVGWV